MKTRLYERHLALGGKMVSFAGWDMPVHYKSIIEEHHAVRKKIGIFDVSHMGRIDILGPDAEKLMDYLSTNSIAGKKDFSATYTVWCEESGDPVDDLIVYRASREYFFVIVNAANRESDLNHLKKVASSYNVIIEARFSDGIIAVQGPSATSLMTDFFPSIINLTPMHFSFQKYEDSEIILSMTGYTGAGGIEIYGPMPAIISLWDKCLEKGAAPIGLGARDTLRLEMGYALYGHELKKGIAPTESVSAWTVKWDHDFLGKEALIQLENQGNKRQAYGIELIDPGIPREGYAIFHQDKKVGIVTSGTWSPTLNHAIALILVERKLEKGDLLEVEIRQRKTKAKIVKIPFGEG